MKAISYQQFGGRAEEALAFFKNALQATNVKMV
ncbi:putative glyoxalase superfamily protein PhnB [Oceanobacillus polygoni]|uniref:Glyoxalase superfamily protein PhnB n=1 Tax=Oceanobacillus polygoni TaxID=1235259 RepID=A0A9X0YWU1_9BACI|nr:putative glyoxalase superfamily protein PhnB [Oceanobacillus polygoni]